MCRFWGTEDPEYGKVAGELGLSIVQVEGHSSQTREVEDKARREDLLKDLDYEGRRNRENQIWKVGADPQTVQWIWNSSFANWTSEAGGLFWICGKPASGKSTLMESLAWSRELKDRLRCRYHGECTIIRHFFDFRAGKDIGNNFEGFLRSLLYQLVGDSRNHKDVNVDGVDLPNSEPRQPWSIRALKEAMKIVLRQHPRPICILLDGLDEYEGDKWSLADFVHELENPKVKGNPKVKICIASRPDSVYNVSFKDLATLKMEERNTPAIDTMMRQKIECMTKPGFYDSSTAVELARRISKMANGVFLWARFAIEEVRDGLSKGMDLPDLYMILDNFPQELEKIYARILEQLKPEDRQKTIHMLQLVCYARRTLTLGELCVAAAHASSEQGLVVEQISKVDIQRFEKKVLALTGGVLEMVPSLDEVHASREADKPQIYRNQVPSGVVLGESWETDGEPLSHESLDAYETDLYEGREIDGAEPHGSPKPDEAEPYKVQKVEGLIVSVIHRTFRTYMESTGWLQLLNARHEGMLHAHVLWLRVCTGVFPASFKGLPPGDHGSEMTQKSSPVHSNTQSSSRRTSDSWLALGETVYSPLLEYAAVHMLTHALRIEQDLGLRYYEILYSGMSKSFLCYHTHYTDGSCECYLTWPKPSHPLHLAIGHGLVEYVKAYLSMVGDQGSREWDQVSYLEVAKRLPWGSVDPSGTAQMSLLEFAIRHAGRMPFMNGSRDLQYLVVAEILDHYPRVDDAAILVALDRCSVRVLHLLLSHLPSGKMAIKSGIWNADGDIYEDVSKHEVLGSIQKPFDVGPLWYIARRHYLLGLKDAAELIDLFLGRGEDINEQCGPFGTALHGALLRVNSSGWDVPMLGLLVSKGADINAVGPFGTPLAFVWRMLRTSTSYNMRQDKIEQYQTTIRWLIHKGATNNQPDPNEMIPTREQMLRFAEVGIEDLWDFNKLYRGDSVHEESGEDTDMTEDDDDKADGPDEPDEEDVEG